MGFEVNAFNEPAREGGAPEHGSGDGGDGRAQSFDVDTSETSLPLSPVSASDAVPRAFEAAPGGESADKRIERLGLPNAEQPVQASTLDDAVSAIEQIGMALIRDDAEQTIARGFTVPEVPLADPKFEPGEPVGTAPPLRRTPGSWLVRLSRDEQVRSFEKRLAIIGDADTTGFGRELRNRLVRTATHGILRTYGVGPKEIRHTPGHTGIVEFPHKGNAVRLTVSGHDIDVVAFDSRLTPEEQERVEGEHSQLEKRGAAIAGFHHYLQTGRIPEQLADLRPAIEAGKEQVEAAYAAHAQRVHDHAVLNGYRSFNVHSESPLRLGLPLAMHLVEQQPDVAEGALGAYSPTHGFVYTRQAGFFMPATHPRAGGQNRTELWGITKGGSLRRVR